MKKIKYTENDLYNAMVRNVDEDAIVYGANGHYAIGAYYDITKIVSTNGIVDYNNKSNFENNKDFKGVKQFMSLGVNKDDLNKDIYKY